MDKRAMAKDRSAIDSEIGRVRSIVALGRYVPFPDHSIPADVSWQNYQYFVWRWKEMTGKRD
jgi:uroporphyrinogen decarboxylase